MKTKVHSQIAQQKAWRLEKRRLFYKKTVQKSDYHVKQLLIFISTQENIWRIICYYSKGKIVVTKPSHEKLKKKNNL